jgi:hypothetical protein
VLAAEPIGNGASGDTERGVGLSGVCGGHAAQRRRRRRDLWRRGREHGGCADRGREHRALRAAQAVAASPGRRVRIPGRRCGARGQDRQSSLRPRDRDDHHPPQARRTIEPHVALPWPPAPPRPSATSSTNCSFGSREPRLGVRAIRRRRDNYPFVAMGKIGAQSLVLRRPYIAGSLSAQGSKRALPTRRPCAA